MSAITNSSLTLNNLFIDHIKNIINVLKTEENLKLIVNKYQSFTQEIGATKNGNSSISKFPTDMQAQLMSLLALTGVIQK